MVLLKLSTRWDKISLVDKFLSEILETFTLFDFDAI